MRRSPSLKAPRSPDRRGAVIGAAAAAMAAAEIAQRCFGWPWWLFAALRMGILLGACGLLWRIRPPERDGLTGAAGYGAYARFLEAGAPAERVCVFFLDVDNLKRVNDTYGHEAGDRLLARLAASFGPVMGPGDTLFRVGGDEFVFLAADRTGADAPELLRRWREELSRLNEGGEPVLSVSCGWSAGAGRDFSALVRRADDAMYRMKNEKRS